jgi:two-component system sensor histidine kinase PilS (NtrC family)
VKKLQESGGNVDLALPGNKAHSGAGVHAAGEGNIGDSNERSWLEWLVKVRVIVITFLLGIVLAIGRLAGVGKTPEHPFISLILLWYTIALFHAVLLKMWRETRAQSLLQVLTDLVFATAVTYLTGGIDTWFNFLYPLIIIVASILLPRIWSYATALLSFILFGAIVELSYLGIIRSYAASRVDEKSLQIVIFINLLAYLLVAYLASSLSAKLRQADVELARKSGALENLQALHENIINCMSGGLITTDLEGRVTVLNASAERLLGIAGSGAVGKPVTQLFLDKLPNVGTSIERGEVRCLTPDGQEMTFAVNVTALAVPERGEIGYVYAFDDLTEVRRLEQEIRMRDRLAAIGRMAAGIAHEIRNPLASIAGSVQVLSAISELNEEQRSLVDIVVRESDRLNAIVSDFLVYARDKAYRMAPADLVPLLDDTLHLLESRAANASQVTFMHHFEVGEAWAVVDAERMRQVFWNLGDHALRRMNGSGGILTVTLTRGSGVWRISFSDTGPGFTSQQTEKLFEPFQAKAEGSTGLGLAIVYQILQGHGAGVSVYSLPGKGTEFVLDLRQAARPAPAVSPSDQPAAKAVSHG